MNRYSLIKKKMPREFVLLQGTGCKWGGCTFCDYHKDISNDPYEINREVLLEVTGEFGVLDVINSGSCVELDDETVKLIAYIVKEKNIHTLWFEAHWMYRGKLKEFSNKFPNVNVKFRTGIETFDGALRTMWAKGISEDVTVSDILKYFNGICLLVGIEGQSKECISNDINIALNNFEYFSVNVFVPNLTDMNRDDEIIEWFLDEWTKKLNSSNKSELLISNTDLGVG